MTRKTEDCYRHIFEYIEENVFSLRCKSFMTDFEFPTRNALRTIYPNSEFYTCWFHLTQAAKKNMSKLRALSKLIRRNEEARIIYKKLLALPLLPADLIVEAFHKLKTLALSKFKEFKTYLAYFERQWLQRVIDFFTYCNLSISLFETRISFARFFGNNAFEWCLLHCLNYDVSFKR